MSGLRAAALAVAAATVTASIAPEQFHIAIAGAAGMRIAWKTGNASDTTCFYGVTPAAIDASATGTAVNYFPGLGYHHSVLIGPLANSTQYYYKCGNATAPGGLSQTFSFTSAPTRAPGGEFTTLVFGDWGYLGSAERGPALGVGGLETNWSATLSRRLMETLARNGEVDQIWITGDIAYQDDSFGYLPELLNFTYEETLDGWMGWIQNVSSKMPFMVTVGNHESEDHSPAAIIDLDGIGLHLNNFSAYNARWAMPSPESNGVLSMWYSWNFGRAHFVSINTETDWPGAEEETTGDSHLPFLPAGGFAPNGTYYAWLEADLAAAAADPAVRWIIAGGHRPFEDLDDNSRAVVGGLFSRYGVRMYFAGHGHSYSRYNISAWGDGVVHIMAGGSGCDEMPYPSDQHSAPAEGALLPEDAVAAHAACMAWCTSPEVRAVAERQPRAAGLNALPRALPTSGPSARLAAAAAAAAAPSDPCKYCAGAPQSGEQPLVTSALMALGTLKVTDDALTFQLLRAPDGAVLDTFTLRH